MGKRSLQASSEGIRKAKQAFKIKGWTQEYLANEVGLETRQPIWKFFSGKPVERQVFNEICLILNINPDEVVQTDKNVQEQKLKYLSTTCIPSSEQRVKLLFKEKTQHQCGTLRFLNVSRPLDLDDVYIDINVSEEISSQKWLKLESLENRQQDLKTFPSNLPGLKKSQQSAIDLVAKYPKIIIQGRPGSGKSTFLQAVAIKCIQGKLLHNSIPIFVNLKNFAEKYQIYNQSLFDYIYETFNNEIDKLEFNTALRNALVLLDGLDEVPEIISNNIISEINIFVNKYYKSRVIITCRTSAQSYKFRDFIELEIVDFEEKQVIIFAYQWFLSVAKSSFAEAKSLAEQFIQKLQLSENQQIHQLTTTPLLLSITCLLFYTHGDFPHSRSEVYRQALELLLIRWDEARGIERDELYRNFSLSNKVKLLSQIAKTYSIENQYFFSAGKTQQLIANYLRQLCASNSTKDTEDLLIDSYTILKAIEAQHGLLVERAQGIYSFSHSTFQEYLTARNIVKNVDSQSLNELVNYIHVPSWKEIFLLVAEMLPSTDNLLSLMKQKTDLTISTNPKLKRYIDWVLQKSELHSVSTNAKNIHIHKAAIRAFYFTHGLPNEHLLAQNQDIALRLAPELAVNLPVKMSLDMTLTHTLAISLSITTDVFFQRLKTIHLALDLKHLSIDNQTLLSSLYDLKNELPHVDEDKQSLNLWWLLHGAVWIEKLRSIMINDCQIGYNWEFNLEEYKLIEQYWNACQLILDCMNCTSSTSSSYTQSLVKESLFL
jgi:predicted NACHT family NTPase